MGVLKQMEGPGVGTLVHASCCMVPVGERIKVFVSITRSQGATDNDVDYLGAVLCCVTLSKSPLGMAYLSQAAWKPGCGIWWRGRATSLIENSMRNNRNFR